MRLAFLVFITACATAHLAAASASFAAALALVREKKYPEARAALEAVVAREPDNAAACHRLGLVWKLRNDDEAYAQALTWLARAVELEPDNAHYLGDFGGTSLQLASRTRSLSAATKGRAAMEKAIALAPDDLDAREGLFQFYSRAPWPLGSKAKADAQLAEIRQRNPERAALLGIDARISAKDYDGAFKACAEILAAKPRDYAALYYYGRIAAISGLNLERGRASLQTCLTLAPPGPAAPTHDDVRNRLAQIDEQLANVEGAEETRP